MKVCLIKFQRDIVKNNHFFLVEQLLIGSWGIEPIIQSPCGRKLPYKIDSSLNHKIRFIAREKGKHKLSIKLGDNLITGIKIYILLIKK